MIRVRFNPETLTADLKLWWENWARDSQVATEHLKQAVESGQAPPQYNSRIWKNLKDWLLKNVFQGKCAYCETRIDTGFYGDAEHYRPKDRVCAGGGVIEKDGRPHPGYYWLAYDWRNLLPSCEKCNRGGGKCCKFPVAKEHVWPTDTWLPEPSYLDSVEEPLLLNPYQDDPQPSLQFGVKGMIAAKDDRGTATISACDLRRETLRRDRQQAQEDAWRSYLMDVLSERETREAFFRKLRERPHTAACADYIAARYEENEPRGHAKAAITDQIPTPASFCRQPHDQKRKKEQFDQTGHDG